MSEKKYMSGKSFKYIISAFLIRARGGKQLKSQIIWGKDTYSARWNILIP